jgi:hypothetical protein
MNVMVKRILNPNNNQETGAILTVLIDFLPENYQKTTIEQELVQYAFDNLYPGQGLNFYSNIENDTISIVAIRGIDDIDYETIEIEEPKRRISTFKEFIGGFKNRKI